MPDTFRPMILAAAVVLVQTSATDAQSAPRLDQVSWLTGCWEASNGPRIIEERWMAPRGGSMIGVGGPSGTTRSGTTSWYCSPRRTGASLMRPIRRDRRPTPSFRAWWPTPR